MKSLRIYNDSDFLYNQRKIKGVFQCPLLNWVFKKVCSALPRNPSMQAGNDESFSLFLVVSVYSILSMVLDVASSFTSILGDGQGINEQIT